MNWYYYMWLDAIEKVNSVHSSKSEGDKNFGLLCFFAMAQVANILSINFILFLSKIKFTTYSFTENYFINFLFLAIIPLIFVGLNYFLFFYKKKYVLLISKKKEKRGGKLFIYYFFISCCLLVLLLILL